MNFAGEFDDETGVYFSVGVKIYFDGSAFAEPTKTQRLLARCVAVGQQVKVITF